MAVTEDMRHELYKGLEEVMDTQRATTLMELLPPVGWADVATKQDLEKLELRIESLGNKLRAEWERNMRRFLMANYTTTVGLAAVLVAAVKLI